MAEKVKHTALPFEEDATWTVANEWGRIVVGPHVYDRSSFWGNHVRIWMPRDVNPPVLDARRSQVPIAISWQVFFG
jgi:hypothetical protein